MFTDQAELAAASTASGAIADKKVKTLRFSRSFQAPVVKFEQLLKNKAQPTTTSALHADVTYAARFLSSINDTRKTVFQTLSTLTAAVEDPNAESVRMISTALNLAFGQETLNVLSGVLSQQDKSAAAKIYETAGPLQAGQQASFTALLATTQAATSATAALVGTGFLQFELSWDTEGTDVDLHVRDPDNEEIAYYNQISSSGGFLDMDNTYGFGPETITWVSNSPDGKYVICVQYFRGEPETHATIIVRDGLGLEKSYQVTLKSPASLVHVVTISKSGDVLTFP